MLLYDINTTVRTVLLCMVFLLLWLTLMLLAETVYQRMYKGFSVFFAFIVLVNYFFFQLCLDEKYDMYLETVIVYICVMLFFDIVIIRKGIKYRRGNFTVISVKQGLDAMTEGICFYTTDGLPQFVNRPMTRISRSLTGGDISDAVLFWDRLKRGEVDPSCKIISGDDELVIVRTPEKVCAFSNRDMEAGDELKEMVMVDITSEYETFKELAAKKEALEQQRERLKEYNRNVTKATIEKELLNAKVNIHDELGEILLAAKRYIKSGEGDRKTLKELWMKNLKLLGVEKQTDKQDEYEEIYKAASDIGMKIVLKGKLPDEDRAKNTVASALHECITNTFRHAGGDTVYVEVDDSGFNEVIRFTNNGNPPEGTIYERGGLKSLRRIAEAAGIEMKIEAEPEFVLTLVI